MPAIGVPEVSVMVPRSVAGSDCANSKADGMKKSKNRLNRRNIVPHCWFRCGRQSVARQGIPLPATEALQLPCGPESSFLNIMTDCLTYLDCGAAKCRTGPLTSGRKPRAEIVRRNACNPRYGILRVPS